ncbi:MAG TPA: MFS transporter [Syntrophorhabdales bacterium]|nr:MFS transporter [Syntrophorhabdales bacterium]
MKAVDTAQRTESLLHNRPLLLFWLARVSTTVAYQMLAVAVGWQIYALTRSPFYLGLVGLAQFLPMLLLTLLVGHVADRYDRRRILRTCQLIEGLGVVALAASNYAGWTNEKTILAIVLVLGAARAFELPTLHALLPNLVSTDFLPRAVALSTSSGQTAVIVGPALGGLLYALHPTLAYGTVAALFLAASLFVSLIRAGRKRQHREPVTLQSLFAGIAFIRSRPAILGAISLDLFAVLLGGATALLPVYAREILVIGPWGLGVLRSAPAAGALLMSVFLAHHPLQGGMGRTMFIAVIVFGIGTIGFGLSTSFALSLICLAVLGAADVISVVIRQSLVQTRTPDEMRGRVTAVNSMFVGTSNQLGEFESGLTAAWFGVVPAVLIGGVGTIVVAALWVYMFPDLARIDTVKQ